MEEASGAVSRGHDAPGAHGGENTYMVNAPGGCGGKLKA